MNRRQLFQYFAYAALALCLVGCISAVRKQPHCAQPALSNSEVLELARLRVEVTRLRNEVQSTRPSFPSSRLPLITNAPPAQAAVLAVMTLTARLSANVGLGQALAVGGWIAPGSGRRIVGLISPELDGSAPGAILVTARIVELADADMEKLGLHTLRTDRANSQAQKMFTVEQFKALVASAEKLKGTSVVAMPHIVTESGRPAQIAVREMREDGPTTGQMINFTSTLDATRTSVRLDMNMELKLLTTAPAP